MKKSFLNRAMAAAIAVPVALSQTVLFTSFAEDQVPITNVIDVQTFVNVPVENTKASPITEVTKYEVYEKESTWNQQFRLALNSLDGTVQELNTDSMIDQIARLGKWYKDIFKLATKATAEIDGTDVVLTFDVNFGEDAQAILKNKVVDTVMKNSESMERSVVEAAYTTDVLANSKGTVTVTIDTASLDADKAVSFTASAVTDQGEIKTLDAFIEYFDGKIEAYRNELVKDTQTKIIPEYTKELTQAEADLAAAEAAGKDVSKEKAELELAKVRVERANHMVETAIDEVVDEYRGLLDDLKNKGNNALDKEVTQHYEEANYNAVLKKAQAAADARTSDTSKIGKAVNKVPETISEMSMN